MSRRAELSDFLRSRRARLDPRAFGPRFETERPRRVPGLRREEVAQLAGGSLEHYVRLEQGRELRFSDSVIDAVARALQLPPHEHEHLRNLTSPREHQPEVLRPSLWRLLEAVGHLPAVVVGRRLDVLAWNRMATELLTDFGAVPIERRNIAWLAFTDPQLRSRYTSWPAKADSLVAQLRFNRGRHPEDPEFTALLAELAAASPEFAQRWSKYQVTDKTFGPIALHHPRLGQLDLAYERLRLPDDPDQALVTYTPEPGSAVARALAELAAGFADRTASVRG